MNPLLENVDPSRVKHFLCSVCGADTGNFWIAPEGVNEADVSMQDLHISDTRCDEHPPINPADQPPVEVVVEEVAPQEAPAEETPE